MRFGEHALGDLIDGVALDQIAALGAVGAAGAGVEQAHVIIDFGGRGDGGARVARGVFLADGDGGSDAGDFVDIGLFHALEELTGVSGERFDVATLAFGVDGIENEGRLAGAGDAGYNGEEVVGDGEGDVFEIVDAGAADEDGFVERKSGRTVWRSFFQGMIWERRDAAVCIDYPRNVKDGVGTSAGALLEAHNCHNSDSLPGIKINVKNERIITIPSNHSVDQSVNRIKGILESKGITLFALVDHSGEAAKVGMKMPPTRLLIFGSPKAGTPLMLAAPSIAIDLPLKILVWEDGQGKAWLSYNDPEYLKERHGLPQDLVANIAVVGVLAAKAAE